MIRPTNLKQTSDAQVWQLWLDGARDLLDVWNLKPSDADCAQWRNQREALSAGLGFFGVGSEAEARAVLTNGYSDGAKLCTDLAREIEEELPPPKSRRRTRKWNDDGDEISYERLVQGREPWLSSHRQLRSACGLVEVVSSWGADCSASQDQLQWSGAASLALCDLLERADYSTELALVAGMRSMLYVNNRQTLLHELVRIDLKRMGELLDVEQLAAVAVYPPAWRIYGLCAFQQGPGCSGTDYHAHPHLDPIHAISLGYTLDVAGLWGYRPNVMTLTLGPSGDRAHAKQTVLSALKQLSNLVDPQEELAQ